MADIIIEFVQSQWVTWASFPSWWLAWQSLVKKTDTDNDVEWNNPIPLKLTTTERVNLVSPIEWMLVYDITLHKLCIRTTTWEIITSV